MPLVGKHFTGGDTLRIILKRISFDLCVTTENATSKQDSPALFAMENDTSEVSIPKASECEGVPQKSGMEEETIPQIKPRGRGRPRKDGKPRVFPLKDTIPQPQATKCEGVNRRGRPRKGTLTNSKTEKCLPDTRPSRLTREMKRRTPIRCEHEIAQPFELSNLKRQRFTETDTLGLVTQSVSTDIGITSENVAPKQNTVARTLRIVIERVSTHLCNTRENVTIKQNSAEEDTSIIQPAKQTTPAPFVIGNVELENSNIKKKEHYTSKISIPKASECVDIPQKNYNQDETEPKDKEDNEGGPRGRGRPRKDGQPKGRGRPRKDGQPKGRGRPRKEIIRKASECEGVRPKGRPKAITEKCLSDTRPSRLTREIKRRAPCYCCEQEIAQRWEVSNFKRQRFTEVDTLGLVLQSVSSDLGITSENVSPQQTTVKEDTAIKQASKQSTPDPFVIRNAQFDNDINKETVSKPNECKGLPLKTGIRKETISKASKLKEVRPRVRPRKEVLPKASECKEVRTKGCPSKEARPKASECQGIVRRGCPRKDGKCKDVTPLISTSKKKKWEKCASKNPIKTSSRQCLKCGSFKSNHGIYCLVCQRNPIEKSPTTAFPNHDSACGALITESVENVVNLSHDEHRDNSIAPDIHEGSGGIGSVTITQETTVKNEASIAFLQSSGEYECGIGYENVSEKVPASSDDAMSPFLQSSNDAIIAFEIKPKPPSDYDADCAQLFIKDETQFPQHSCDLISAFIRLKKEPESNDDAITSYLQCSNETIDAIEIKTEPPSNYDAVYAQIGNGDETMKALKNSSALINAYIKVKTEPKSNDDARRSYLQSSNETFEAIQIKTEPTLDFDACTSYFQNSNKVTHATTEK